jgi:hypothetical protein
MKNNELLLPDEIEIEVRNKKKFCAMLTDILRNN